MILIIILIDVDDKHHQTVILFFLFVELKTSNHLFTKIKNIPLPHLFLYFCWYFDAENPMKIKKRGEGGNIVGFLNLMLEFKFKEFQNTRDMD